MNHRVSLNFHQTFAPERECLSKLVELSGRMTVPMTKEEIFEDTGIPTGKRSGKVEPHIRYAEFMGLVVDRMKQGTHLMERTALGQAIFDADPYFLEGVTLVTCHYNISRFGHGAGLWQFVFQKLVPNLGRNIAQDVLEDAVSLEFRRPRVNLTPLRTCYTAGKSWGSLNLLEVSSGSPKIWEFREVPYRKEYQYVYAYTLLSTWEQWEFDRPELTCDELLDKLHWNKPFMWDRVLMMSVLELLSEIGIISLDKQLTPITIIRRSTAAEVLASLYKYLL